MTKVFTLVFVQQDSRLLLGMKKRGFGSGRWNGFGGKVESGESIVDAAKREVQEEIGITVCAMVKSGLLHFRFHDKPEDVLEVHVFRAESFDGEPVESEEMRPEWFETNAIPYKEMWPDDVHWLPLFLQGKKFEGKFLFGPGDSILEHSLEENTIC